MVVDNHGRTPLHGAAISGCSEAVRILVEAAKRNLKIARPRA